MRLDIVRTVAVLYETGSVQTTADILDIKPCLVLHRVKMLERELGMQLFSRTPWYSASRKRLWVSASSSAKEMLELFAEAIALTDRARALATEIGNPRPHYRLGQGIIGLATIERAIRLEGRGVGEVANEMGRDRSGVARALYGVEKWLNIALLERVYIGRHKATHVVCGGSEPIMMLLKRIVGINAQIRQLCEVAREHGMTAEG
mgnify:CR=1 FL=1